jgi:hypothetical protein
MRSEAPTMTGMLSNQRHMAAIATVKASTP